MHHPKVVAIVDAPFEEQVAEVSAFLSRSKPEAERDAFIASFLPSTSSAAAAAAEGENAEEKVVEVPVEQKGKIVERLVAEVKDAGEGTDKDLEGAFNLLAALVLGLFAEQEAKVEALLSQLAKAVVANSSNSEKNLVRYRILSNLFNTIPETSPLRCEIYVSLVSFAAANDELDLISSTFDQLPTWLAQWKVTAAQKDKTLETVATTLNEAASAEAGADPQRQKKAYEFHVLYLRFLSSSSEFSAKAKTVAEKVIAQAVSFPSIFDFEALIKVPAVHTLIQDASSPVGALVKILSSGSAKEYQQWVAKNKAEVQRLGIAEDQLDRKIRLLDLADLCASSVSKEISYKKIAETISISEDEVEVWVIDVIRAGLVSGKLSQTNQIFRVYRSTHRTFGKEQWSTLEERLVEWQGAIGRILDTITRSRPALAGSSAAAGAQDSTNAASSGEGISVA